MPPVTFEPAFLDALRELFEERIVFNRVLGLKMQEVTAERVQASLTMREDLIGAYAHRRIHGGVISASLDALGGLAVMAAIAARHMDESVEQRMHRLHRLGTIDLRVDYLRPGIGEQFHMEARALRVGSRVASTTMAFYGADGRLLSTGSAAYIVS